MWTGTRIASTSKPHGLIIAMSSSNQPQYDSRSASRNDAAMNSAKSPVSEARSTSSIRSPNESATSSPVTARKIGQFRSLKTSSASGPSSAAMNSSTFSSPMPAR